jgi:hypothetical protein
MQGVASWASVSSVGLGLGLGLGCRGVGSVGCDSLLAEGSVVELSGIDSIGLSVNCGLDGGVVLGLDRGLNWGFHPCVEIGEFGAVACPRLVFLVSPFVAGSGGAQVL